MYLDPSGHSYGLALMLASVNPVLLVMEVVAITILTTVAVKAIVSEVNNSQNTFGEYEVYKLVDPSTQEVVYVGRTKNPTARKNWHSITRIGLEYQTVDKGLTKDQARGLEQYYIISNDTLKPKIDNRRYNQIKGISSRNPRLIEYLIETIKYLGDRAENWVLDQFGR